VIKRLEELYLPLDGLSTEEAREVAKELESLLINIRFKHRFLDVDVLRFRC